MKEKSKQLEKVINEKINKTILLFYLMLMLLHTASAQTISPFNKLPVKDSSKNYSFIVSGHFHGASTNASSFPSSSLLANIDSINGLNPLFLMSLGDLFLDVNDSYISHYNYSLFSKLKMPMFNAVGNHDLAGNVYEKWYGKTFFFFSNNSELFIILNTEINDGSIKDEQLKLFANAMDTALLPQIKNVFIFSHRPVWAERIKKYDKLFSDNTRTAIGNNNFKEDIKPIIQKISKNKNVFWLSGSMGGMAPASFFFDKDDETNVTFMQTAIRDLPRDAMLQININGGIVSLKGISLTGQQLLHIEKYNMEYWNKTIAPEHLFNYRLLPYLAKQMLMHHFFWLGFFSCFLFIFCISFIRKRWKKRK